ncbi:MAG: transporter substrate-binding domain-containing protein, partial [Steroidobacteraceae bacterium]
MKTVNSALVVLACLAGAVAQAASPTLERVNASGVLRVGTPGDYRPYSDRDTSVEAWRGSDVELVRGLAAHLGVSLEFVPTNWANLMTDYAAGRFDMAVGGISITPERRSMASFSDAVAVDGKTALALCSKVSSLDQLRELDRRSVTVIVNPGGTNERFARERLPRAKLIVHRDNLTVFDEVVQGRADAMITDGVEATLQQRAHPGVLCAAHPDKPFDRASKAFLLPKDGVFNETVDDWLDAERKRGELAKVQQRWIDAPWQPGSRLLALIDARLAVMSDVARAKWNSGAPIEDTARETELLSALVRQGEALG